MSKPSLFSPLLNAFDEVKQLRATLASTEQQLRDSRSAAAKLANDLTAAQQQAQRLQAQLVQRETAHLRRVRELEEQLYRRPVTRRIPDAEMTTSDGDGGVVKRD